MPQFFPSIYRNLGWHGLLRSLPLPLALARNPSLTDIPGSKGHQRALEGPSVCVSNLDVLPTLERTLAPCLEALMGVVMYTLYVHCQPPKKAGYN